MARLINSAAFQILKKRNFNLMDFQNVFNNIYNTANIPTEKRLHILIYFNILFLLETNRSIKLFQYLLNTNEGYIDTPAGMPYCIIHQNLLHTCS